MNKNDIEWNKNFELAKEFFRDNGNLLIPQRFKTKDGVKLGLWIHQQRKAYKNDRISQKRIKLLEGIGMVWDASPNLDAIWFEKYKLAKKYFEENGNLLIPQKYETKDGFELGKWISNQKQKYKKGELSQDKIEFLENLNIIWNEKDASWFEKYDLAKRYFEENGNLLITHYYEVNGIKLGHWILNQRQNYKSNKISQERIKLLEGIGMIWDASLDLDAIWFEKYDLAKRYFEENGNLLIPNNYETKDGIKLGIWIQSQRKNYKTNKLSQEKIELLDAIGMVWDASLDYDKIWIDRYNLAKNFFEENGHLLIPNNYETIYGIKLDIWVATQKELYKKGELSQEKIELLEAIGIIWDVLETKWQECFNLAKKYYEKNGHLLIPNDYEVNGIKLGKWVSTQRIAYKKRKNALFTQERINLLESIGMVWDVSFRNGTSFPEYFIYYILNEYYGEDKVSYRDKSLGFELDIYIPHLNLAIEYDGFKWHNNEKDIEKDIRVSSKGITLYRLREPGLDKLETSNCFCLNNPSSNISKLTKEVYDFISDKFSIDINYSFEEIYNEYALLSLKSFNPQWQKIYNLAKNYYEENGNLLIPFNYETKNGFKLGRWLSRQREYYRKGTLFEERIQLLNDIGMVWDVKQQKKRAMQLSFFIIIISYFYKYLLSNCNFKNIIVYK